MEIVPGILAKTLKELKRQLDAVSWAKKVHIDIMDGKFVPNKTISALTLKKAIPDLDMQIHLMANKPHNYVEKFARMGAKELIIHKEATKNSVETLEMIREKGMKAGIAYNPQTKVDETAIHADIALIMTVQPGYSGQQFIKTPLNKIAELRKINPTITIGIDGGINHTTCRLAKIAQANFAIATSAVTLTQNPKKAYKELSK